MSTRALDTAAAVTVPSALVSWFVDSASRRPSVISLIFSCGPTAVFWCVVAVIVYAFYGQPIGALTHVGKEIVEGAPSFAYGYASTAVIVVALIGWLRASANHGFPSNVFGRANTVFAPAGFCLEQSRKLSAPTAAANIWSSTYQVWSRNINRLSALARATPIGVCGFARDTRNHGQTSEYRTRKIEWEIVSHE